MSTTKGGQDMGDLGADDLGTRDIRREAGRALAAGAFASAARLLRAAAGAAESLARQIEPPTPPPVTEAGPGPVGPATTPPPEPAPVPDAAPGPLDPAITPAPVQPPGSGVGDDGSGVSAPDPTAPEPAGEGRTRRPESRVTEIAEQNVRAVIGEIPSLSTDELAQLHEYESAHKNRKTVLAAIEMALSPP